MLRDKNFIEIAKEIAKGSKCVSIQVGAVIVKDTRILSTGYNGTPSGYTNCRDHWKGEHHPDHHEWSLKYEIHAEMNALLYAARRGVSIEGATLYTVYQPCFQCTKNIIAAGIKRIVYEQKYKHVDTDITKKFIIENGIEVVQCE